MELAYPGVFYSMELVYPGVFYSMELAYPGPHTPRSLPPKGLILQEVSAFKGYWTEQKNQPQYW